MERGNGREEKRNLAVLNTEQFEQEDLYKVWPELGGIIRMGMKCLCDGDLTKERGYYLS